MERARTFINRALIPAHLNNDLSDEDIIAIVHATSVIADERTKLEHGKMLAWMKFECRRDGPDGAASAERLIEGRALIAEIEGYPRMENGVYIADEADRERIKESNREYARNSPIWKPDPIDLGIPGVLVIDPTKIKDIDPTMLQRVKDRKWVVPETEPDKSGTGFINNFHDDKSTRGECAL